MLREKELTDTRSPKPTNSVHPGQPRTTAQVRFTDGRIYEAPLGTQLEAYVRAADVDAPWPMPVMAALIDHELRELTYHIERDVAVTPLGMDDRDGSRVYRRSLTFLLVVATQELFPEARLHVDHSVTFGGYYCEVAGRPPFSPEELAAIEARMWEIVRADAPIDKQRVPLADAIAMFRQWGDEDKVRLLSHRRKDYLVLYQLRGVSSYFHGYMAPSAGYLNHFALHHYPPGFILRFPRRSSTELDPVVEYPKLIHVFREYGQTLRLLGIEDVGALNQAIEAGRTGEIILVAEALHEQRIAQIASQIASRRDQVRLVLMAGPSSSGKTTFSKRLAVQLLANGLRPIAVEMDNYFVDRDLTPRDAQGNYDFEVLEALDLKLFNQHLLQLMAGEEVQLPKFNFVSGRREVGETIQLGPDEILLVEGIHGLNPALVPDIPATRLYRIYVSALTQLNIDRYNRVPTTDTRLLRRIVRDARTRGYSTAETIDRWDSVRRGEREFIFPYQENADVMFNSALVYEVSELKALAEPLLLQIEPGKPGYVEAKRLLAFLQWFLPMPIDPIPDNSILREFIGGSNLADFKPWR
ncbi:MAG: nucleoside kinase [Chloroflexi bacterium HGW-Chloroflexi-1]|nr:MAG: nucleoside kinase [Chloroflexi bacterium HGW-Chloroflexi-1]